MSTVRGDSEERSKQYVMVLRRAPELATKKCAKHKCPINEQSPTISISTVRLLFLPARLAPNLPGCCLLDLRSTQSPRLHRRYPALRPRRPAPLPLVILATSPAARSPALARRLPDPAARASPPDVHQARP